MGFSGVVSRKSLGLKRFQVSYSDKLAHYRGTPFLTSLLKMILILNHTKKQWDLLNPTYGCVHYLFQKRYLVQKQAARLCPTHRS